MFDLLLEDYGNLNRIESSLINKNYRSSGSNDTGKIDIRNSTITNNSKIVVDRINPHTFSHAFEMLDSDDTNPFIEFVYQPLNHVIGICFTIFQCNRIELIIYKFCKCRLL